jgi:hypothetical protein
MFVRDRGRRGVAKSLQILTCLRQRLARRRRCGPRPSRRVYDEAVREALIVLWEASDPDLWQTAAATAADPSRGHGAAWPCAAGAGGAHEIAGDERGND